MLSFIGNSTKYDQGCGGARVPRDISIKFGDLVKASFLQRSDRFLVLCRLDHSKEIALAHLADPGRLKELLVPGALLYLRFTDNPKRKTQWSVVLVMAPDGVTLVSLQPTLANHLAAQAIERGGLPELGDWRLKRPEYAHGNSRWDFLLENAQGAQMLLEVKSCTLVNDGIAMFPDAVTKRGKRHVQELAQLHASGGFFAAMLFVVQRADARAFRPATHIDPAFAEALRLAHSGGVKVAVYNSEVDVTAITWGRELSIDFA